MNITDTISNFPDYAKDIKLNYSKIINEAILENSMLYSVILISSITTKCKVLIDAAYEESKSHISEEMIEDVKGAFAIMSMNAIYYRFTHLATENSYSSMPANLRMQYMGKHKVSKSNFEMLCLAVAILMGCGKCINAHEAVLRENNVENIRIQTVARIASIMNSIANILEVKS